MTDRRALVVRGGWEGHRPVESTDLFVPFLRENHFEVSIEDSPEVYADAAIMRDTDLIVQCITMSQIGAEALEGLRSAVADGVGFTGWHGGIADSFRMSADYLQLVGGQFATHPSRPDDSGASTVMIDYSVEMTPLGRDHPITRGVGDFSLHTEQYWVLSDDLNDVLATTTHPALPGDPWHRPVTCPAIWTRGWGKGSVVVTTPGHDPGVLAVPQVRTVIERAMLWAARSG